MNQSVRARERRVQAIRMGAGAQRLYDWLAQQPMPVTVSGREDVDLLRQMVAAGFVRALVPPPVMNRNPSQVEQPPAVVTALTSTGRSWRRKLYAGPAIAGITPPAPVRRPPE